MNRSALAELLRNGESSGVEFKRDDVRPERLAREIAALLNFEGGHILLGVDDDASVRGLARPPKRVEEWVMEVARSHLRPAAVPYWETIDCEGSMVAVISLPADAPDKPYKAKRGSAWVTQVRVGTRRATPPTRKRPVSTCSRDDCSTTAGPFPVRRSTTSTAAVSSTTSATCAASTARRRTTRRPGAGCSSTRS